MTRPEIFDLVTQAFERGRWVMLTNSDGVPQEVTLDLKERDDDLLGAEAPNPVEKVILEMALDTTAIQQQMERFGAAASAFTAALEPGHDDHGPAVPAQTRAADAAERIMAAERSLGRDAADRVRDQIRAEEGLPPLSEVLPDPLPPVGPLTSTEGLKRGDVLRTVWSQKYGGMAHYGDGALVALIQPNGPKGVYAKHLDGEDHCWDVDRFAFVGRPDADGWMDWPGGENPVGDAMVEIDTFAKGFFDAAGSGMAWNVSSDSGYRITRFRLVDMPPLTGDA